MIMDAGGATLRGSPCPCSSGWRLVALCDDLHPAQAGLIVVTALVGSLRELDLLPRDLLVRNCLENVRDDVEPRPSLVVGADQSPRCMLRVGRLEHHVARPRVVVPAPE